MGDKADQTKNEVKRICADLGITQKRLAEIMEVSEASVTDWARGRTPTPKWAIKMFSLLKKERQLDAILDFAKQNAPEK
jgi:DNA-binding transcriptional regulator YiaG